MNFACSPGAEWWSRCVSLHCSWVEECRARVSEWQPQTTGKTGTTRLERVDSKDMHTCEVTRGVHASVFADLLWHHLRDGSKVFGGANGSGWEWCSMLHWEFQSQIQRYTLGLPHYTCLNISNITNISRVFPVVATVSLTPTQTAAHTHNVAVPMWLFLHPIWVHLKDACIFSALLCITQC